MKLLKALGNPYFSFANSFLVATILYSPSLSAIFPDFGFSIYFLLFATISTTYLLGTMSQKKVERIISAPVCNHPAYSTRIFIFALPFALLEIAANPNTPLMMAISGAATHKNFITEYGIPTIHALVVTLFQIVIVQGCNELIARTEGRNKIFLSVCSATCFLIIFLSRGALVICLLASIFCYLSSANKYRGKRIVATLITVVFALYIFGWLGNLRTGDDEYILKIGGANTDVFGRIISSEFFWGYLYIASPLANLALSIELHESLRHFDLITVVLLDIIPDVISKRITEFNEEWVTFRPLVDPALTVGTIFARPYFFGGPVGAAIVFLWTLFLIHVSLNVSEKSPYATTILGFANALAFLCIFTNTAVFSGTIGPIYICLAFGFFKKLKWRTTRSNE